MKIFIPLPVNISHTSGTIPPMKQIARSTLAFPVLLAALLPAPAFANVVMAQKWVYQQPWLIGVLLAIELVVAISVVRRPLWKSLLVVLFANAWSTVCAFAFDAVEITKLIGFIVFMPVAWLFGDGISFMWLGGVFLMSALLEWPIYWLGLAEEQNREAWRLTFLLNGGSYSLFGLGLALGWWWTK